MFYRVSNGGTPTVYYWHSDRVQDSSGLLERKCYIDAYNDDNYIYQLNTNYTRVINKNVGSPYEANMFNNTFHLYNLYPNLTVTALKRVKVKIGSFSKISRADLNNMTIIEPNQTIAISGGGVDSGYYWEDAIYFIFQPA